MSSAAKWIFISILAGCFCIWYLTPLRSPTNSQIVGEYHVLLPWGEAWLNLRSDHSFIEQVRPRIGVNREVRGKWSLSTHWQASLSLTPYWQFTRDDSGASAASAALPVESWWIRDVRIELDDPDSGLQFRKE